MIYAVLGLTSVRFSAPPRAEWWLGPLIGALTGLATAATGVFAIPAVPYLGALKLDKEDMIQALGLSFTVSTVALAVGARGDGAFALAMSALQPLRSRLPFSGWLLAELCAAASASRRSGGSFLPDCCCSALTSRRGR